MIKILIIENEQNSRPDLISVLQQYNFHCTRCSTTDAALKLLRQSTFDLVLASIEIPEIREPLFLKALRKFNTFIQLIVLASDDQIKYADEWLPKDDFELVTDPVNVPHLIALIKYAVHLKQLLEENYHLRIQNDNQKLSLKKNGKYHLKKLSLTEIIQNDDDEFCLTAFDRRQLQKPKNRFSLQVLDLIFREMNKRTTLDDIIKATLKNLKLFIQADIYLFHLLHPGTRTLRLVAESGLDLHEKRCFPLFDQHLAEWWDFLKKGESIIVQAAQAPPVAHPLEKFNLAAVYYFPLSANKKLLGLITIAQRPPNQFTDTFVALFELFCLHLGMLIQNTQLKLKQENEIKALHEKNEELRSFIYTISHDLKSPLGALYGFADVLQNSYKYQLDEKGQDYLNMILVNSELMHRMIDGVLELSRIGRVLGPRTKFSTRRLLNELTAILDYQLKKKGVTLDYPKKMPIIYADRERIATVFQNLLTNSIKFSSPEREPRICINWKEQADDYLFWISDNGIGISAPDQKYVFDLFRKLGGEQFNGTGVGLTIVKKILEYHGGKIWVESELDVGTTFYFTIPKYSRIQKLALQH